MPNVYSSFDGSDNRIRVMDYVRNRWTKLWKRKTSSWSASIILLDIRIQEINQTL